MGVIIGEISDEDDVSNVRVPSNGSPYSNSRLRLEKKIELRVEIYCTNCGKKVPSGLKAGEIFSKTEEFKIELKEFMKNYLCGICRDKKRVTKLKS